MDPYLESPEIFPDFHDSAITYLREALQANLSAHYFAALGRRLWVEISRRSVGPDVQIQRVRPAFSASGPAGAAAALGAATQPVARPIVVKVPYDEFREPFIEIYTRGNEGKRLVTSIDRPVTLDLQAVFDRCYDSGPYSREIRYDEDPIIPALAPHRAAWLGTILRGD